MHECYGGVRGCDWGVARGLLQMTREGEREGVMEEGKGEGRERKGGAWSWGGEGEES